MVPGLKTVGWQELVGRRGADLAGPGVTEHLVEPSLFVNMPRGQGSQADIPDPG
jgi:hypothetical protein